MLVRPELPTDTDAFDRLRLPRPCRPDIESALTKDPRLRLVAMQRSRMTCEVWEARGVRRCQSLGGKGSRGESGRVLSSSYHAA